MSRDPIRQMDRLQSKLADICDAIDLPPGGGRDGYILPAIEQLVADHKRSVAHADTLLVENGRLRGTMLRCADKLGEFGNEEPDQVAAMLRADATSRADGALDGQEKR